jgi:hypothetical protein
LARFLPTVVPAAPPAHILVRKLDKEEDYFVAISVYMDGSIRILANDEDRAHEFLQGLVLGFPPAFKEPSDLNVDAGWESADDLFAMFCGMLMGAMGWDSMHDLPPSLEESISEARKSLDIGNYKSCVLMSRRALEGLLKFAHKRLLGHRPYQEGQEHDAQRSDQCVYSAMYLVRMLLIYRIINFRGTMPNSPSHHCSTSTSNISRRSIKMSVLITQLRSTCRTQRLKAESLRMR